VAEQLHACLEGNGSCMSILVSAPTQANRLIKLNIPALKDPDKLLLTSFTGQEGISFPFHYDLQLLSTDPRISFEDVIGSEATITIVLPGGNTRIINGIISAFSQGGHANDFTGYQATLVSQMWLLTRVADSRIFQNKTVPQIVREVLDKNHIQHVVENLEHDQYKPREYCVQYAETDFHFISRLMEDEGIFYYFEHIAGTEKEPHDRHVLVIADSISKTHTVPFFSEAEFRSASNKQSQDQAIYSWSMTQEIRPDKYTLRDFDFKKASVMTEVATTPGVKNPTREVYDYPGYFDTFDEGQRLADLRIEEIETANTIVAGSGTCRAFVSAFFFHLKGHYRKDVNGDYLLTTIFHNFSQGDDFCSTGDAASKAFVYTNNFSCIPAERRFRPPRTTQVPVIAGVQTAIVVGRNTSQPNGDPPAPPPPHTLQDEIYTDEFGRVKVRFHWDRAKQNGDNTCYLRVAQNWADVGWGHQWIPRVGQEVIVSFLEADPDRPIITGAVYNRDPKRLPFTTDHYKTQSGIRTRSNPIDPDGPNDRFNMFRFDDKRDCEQVYLRSQKRLDVRALGSYFDTCGGDRNTLIGGKDDKGNQGGDYTLTVGNDTDVHINGGLYAQVGKVVNLSVLGDVVADLKANQSVLVGSKSELNAKQIILEGLEKISLKVGGSFVVIDSSGVTISGPTVKINSGGAGMPCSSPDIDDPLDAAPADTGKPGYVDCSKGGGGGRKRRHRHLNAQHAPPFATTKLPDGSIKVGNSIIIKPDPADASYQDAVLDALTTMTNQPAGMDNLNAINNQPNSVTIQPGSPPQTNYNSWQDGAAKGKPAADGTTGTGKGTGSTINYDPNFTPTSTADPSVTIPNDVVLNHEMSHARHGAEGQDDNTPDAANPQNGTVEESQTIQEENTYRSQRILDDGKPVPQRKDWTTT